MPTVPRLVFRRTDNIYGLSPFEYVSFVPTIVYKLEQCQPIAGGEIGWTHNTFVGTDNPSYAASTIATLPIDWTFGFGPLPAASPISVTYADGLSPYYNSYIGIDGTIDAFDTEPDQHLLYPFFPSVGSPWPNYQITLNSSTMDVKFTWLSTNLYIDGVLYYEGFRIGDLRVGGIETELTPTITPYAVSVNNDVLYWVTSWTSVDIEYRTSICEATLTIPRTTDPIEFRLRNPYGEKMPYFRLWLNPVVSCSFSQDDGDLIMDASAGYSIGTTIADYRFRSTIFDVTQSSPILVEEIDDELSDGDHLTVTVSDTSDLGCQSALGESVTVITVDTAYCIGTSVDAANTIYMAIREGTDVKTYRMKALIAGKETRGTIANAKNPSLWRQDAILFCGVESTAGGYFVYSSKDGARTWNLVTMATIWDDATYSRFFSCGLIGGGAASIATKKSTDPLEVYIKVSGDGISWPASPILVGDYDGDSKQFHVRQKSDGGLITLVVTNSADKAWQSNSAAGVAGSWTEI